MRLLLTTTAVALMSTAAFADQSDRYNDLRLDTSNSAVEVFSDDPNPTDLDRAQRGRDQRQSTVGFDDSYLSRSTISSRSNIRSAGEGFIYGGYGDGNDSR